ncbi:MAG: hypothetical protein R3D45_16400 [Rhizobiaceae bacterium]
MKYNEILDTLCREFEKDTFFYKLRQMDFDENLAKKLDVFINNIDLSEFCKEKRINIVKNIWMMPVYYYIYKERCITNGALEGTYDGYARRFFNRVQEIIESV